MMSQMNYVTNEWCHKWMMSQMNNVTNEWCHNWMMSQMNDVTNQWCHTNKCKTNELLHTNEECPSNGRCTT